MRRLPILLLLAVFLTTAAHAERRPRRAHRPPAPASPVVVPQEILEARLDTAIENLAALSAMAESRVDERARARLRKRLQEARRELLEIRQIVRSAPPAELAPPPVVDYEPPPPPPMDERAFSQALDSLGQHSFSEARLSVVSELARYNLFTVDQVVRLLNTFSFGSDRLKALELVAPRLVDPENGYRIFEALPFDSEKKSARRILEQARP